MAHLDHRGKTFTLLRERGLATFTSKKAAEQFAKSYGWFVKDVTKAANRFHYYWVVCQCVGNFSHYLAEDGSVIRDPWPGYLQECEVP